MRHIKTPNSIMTPNKLEWSCVSRV